MNQEFVIRPKRHKCGSWACSVCGDRIGRALQPRLLERFRVRSETHRAVFVTFTLDPALFGSPLEAFLAIKRNHRVSRAVQEWGRAVGLDHVSYFCKMELQKSGWPHWHLVLDVPRERVDAETGEVLPINLRMPSAADLGDTFGRYGNGSAPRGVWKWGRSDTRFDVAENEVAYLCKYACKEAGGDEALAASGLPDRVNWVTCSRGFWAEAGMAEPSEGDAAVEYQDETISGTIEPASLFERVEYCRRTSICEVTIPTTGETVEFEVPLSRKRFCEALEVSGARVLEVFPESGITRTVAIDAGAFEGLAFMLGGFPFVQFVHRCIDAVDGTAAAAAAVGRAAADAVRRVQAAEALRGAEPSRAAEASPGAWSPRDAVWREALPPGEALPEPWACGASAAPQFSENRIAGGQRLPVSVGGGEKASGDSKGAAMSPFGRSR